MHEMLTVWEKRRIEWFAKDPKCKICGGGFNHYSRNMICRKCQNTIYKNRAREREPEQSRAYRKKHKEKIQTYQQRYYVINREEISTRKKIKYKEKRKRVE